jgi:bifunctional UDP-N-acetylglucosamine pyrophosphorylase/glucosamine-1-phosphate N-acetyltransferase
MPKLKRPSGTVLKKTRLVSDVVVLAAGRGKRMFSDLPKPLQPLAGSPLLDHVLGAALGAFPGADIHVVVSPTNRDALEQRQYACEINWVKQAKQLGTGHAVAQTLGSIQDGGVVAVLYADVPMISIPTLEALAQLASPSELALLTAKPGNPYGYGRIVRNRHGGVERIVEESDASDQEREINEISTGIMIAPSAMLKAQLPNLSMRNRQEEQYLTDIVARARDENVSVTAYCTNSTFEGMGVNSRSQLARAERAFQSYQAEQLMEQGVSLRDANRFDLRGTLRAGRDVSIDVGVVFEGDNYLGDAVQIGAYCVLKDVHIESGTIIKPYSVLERSHVGQDCAVGPYARLRPDTKLARGVQIGNFVEVKKSDIGAGSKVNHLSYIGDSEISEDVNIGAGVITCNYDGKKKHKTRIEKGAFVGSNASLIAPISIGANATVAAGSAIGKDVPGNALGIERGEQKIRENWNKKT